MADWQIRRYREGDEAAIAANWTACFAADGLDIVVSEQEVLDEVTKPGSDASQQTLIVEGPLLDGLPGSLLPGFAWIDIRDDPEGGERIYGLRVSAHPAARRLGLELVLAHQLIEIARAHEASPTTERRERVRVRETFSPKQESQHTLYETIGLRQTRIFWTMECPLDNIPEPQPVEGVHVRTFRRPEDNLAALDALNNSFIDHFDFHPPTPERWEHRLNTHSFRPDLSRVAEIDVEPGRLAGFCLCGIIEEENRATGRLEGWIETLGTVRGWRGMGLGRSLLLHGLHALKGAGLEIGMLGVDSINPTGATRLYESVGFKVRDNWLHYECPLDEVRV
jgi:mycothiol synthase